MKTDTIKVEGMVCNHCEIAINQAVRKLSGVKSVKASRRKEQVVVEYDETQVDSQKILEAISKTGYQVIA